MGRWKKIVMLKVWHIENHKHKENRAWYCNIYKVAISNVYEYEKKLEIHNFICGLSYVRVFYDFRLMIRIRTYKLANRHRHSRPSFITDQVNLLDAKYFFGRKTIVTAHKMKMMWVWLLLSGITNLTFTFPNDFHCFVCLRYSHCYSDSIRQLNITMD